MRFALLDALAFFLPVIEGVQLCRCKFGTNVTKNPFSATFGSLDGLTVTGAWNAEQARVEF